MLATGIPTDLCGDKISSMYTTEFETTDIEEIYFTP